MYKIVKATIVLFAILGVIAVMAVGTRTCEQLSYYKDNLSSYGKVLEAMRDDDNEFEYVVVAA